MKISIQLCCVGFSREKTSTEVLRMTEVIQNRVEYGDDGRCVGKQESSDTNYDTFQ